MNAYETAVVVSEKFRERAKERKSEFSWFFKEENETYRFGEKQESGHVLTEYKIRKRDRMFLPPELKYKLDIAKERLYFLEVLKWMDQNPNEANGYYERFRMRQLLK